MFEILYIDDFFNVANTHDSLCLKMFYLSKEKRELRREQMIDEDH